MPTPIEQAVALRLAELGPTLVAQVTDQLIAALPPVELDPLDPRGAESHRAHMHSTAQRFHDLVQLGATMDWVLTGFEYEWTSRALGSKGVTWEHQAFLISTYFATAERLASWSDEERETLNHMARHLYADGALAYGE
jgi:hypothetical protein